MHLIRLTDWNGRSAWVNPEYVVAVEAMPTCVVTADGKVCAGDLVCTVTLCTGDKVSCRESVEEVVEMVEGALGEMVEEGDCHE